MSTPSGSAKRILIVDDDADTCEVIRFVLERSGYQLTAAGTIADALRLAEAEMFDLYLLDSWLPDGMGIDLCKRFRALYPASPILFCSGAARESDIQTAKAAGAAGYLIKPCDLDLLENMLAGLLNMKDVNTLPRKLVKDSKQKIDTFLPARNLDRAK